MNKTIIIFPQIYALTSSQTILLVNPCQIHFIRTLWVSMLYTLHFFILPTQNYYKLTGRQSQFSHGTSERLVIVTVRRRRFEPSWFGKDFTGTRRRFAIFGPSASRSSKVVQSFVVGCQLTAKGFQSRGGSCDHGGRGRRHKSSWKAFGGLYSEHCSYCLIEWIWLVWIYLLYRLVFGCEK